MRLLQELGSLRLKCLVRSWSCIGKTVLNARKAVGTPASLKSRFATYEIHLQATEVERTLVYLQSHGFRGAHQSLDTLTRISVPGVRENELGKLLESLDGAKGHLRLQDLTLHESVAADQGRFMRHLADEPRQGFDGDCLLSDCKAT